MDRAQLRQELLELLYQDTGQRYDRLDDSVTLKEGLGLDSVDLVSLVMQIENRFHIRLDSQELQRLEKVGDLLDLLQSKLQQASAAPGGLMTRNCRQFPPHMGSIEEKGVRRRASPIRLPHSAIQVESSAGAAMRLGWSNCNSCEQSCDYPTVNRCPMPLCVMLTSKL
jgi:acyl carrier protein